MTSNIMLTLAFLAGVLAVYYLTPRAGRQTVDSAGRQPAFLSERGSAPAAFGGGKRALVLRGRHRHGRGRNKGTEESLAAGGGPAGSSGPVCIEIF